MRARRPALALVTSLALAACATDGAAPSPSTPTALPSGELGVVTQEAVSAAALGLCEVLSGLPTDPETAMATFHDRLHEELHVIAAATQVERVGQRRKVPRPKSVAMPRSALGRRLRRRDLHPQFVFELVKAPFGGPQYVLQYLARSTHRVAISNHRIVDSADGKVTFLWKDYAHGS